MVCYDLLLALILFMEEGIGVFGFSFLVIFEIGFSVFTLKISRFSVFSFLNIQFSVFMNKESSFSVLVFRLLVSRPFQFNLNQPM